jgi:lipid II:glycine glycyltransferase (peptidoglycan interpeptide bridge formation enzyme)
MTTKNLDIISTHPLQTSAWGEFRREWGNEVLETKYGILTLHKIPFTNYKIAMFIKGQKPTLEMLKDLKEIGERKKLIFIKLEPNAKRDEKTIELLRKMGATPGKTLFTPTTFWIDLTKSEEELLQGFSRKTRYNIRLAQKHGVEILEDNSDSAFEKYLDLTKETVQRQGFFAHTKRYHRLMWNKLRDAGIAHLLTAVYKKDIITTWILFVWKDFLYYPYGASSEKYKEVMANNLMMWEAIKFGGKLGLKAFDLWGREEGKGFTKFKEGYNPQVIEFLGTWDLVINPFSYQVYRLAESARWSYLRLIAKIGLSKHRF